MQKRKKTILILILITVVYFTFLAIGIKLNISPQKMRDWIRSFGILSPLVYILTFWLFILIPSLPNPPLLLTGGIAFGTTWGFLLSYFASSTAYIINFTIAKKWGREYIRKIAGENTIKEIDKISDKVGKRGIFLLRLVPGFSFDVLSYAAGLSKISLKDFIISFFFPQMIVVFVVVSTGDLSVRTPKLMLALLGISLIGFLISSLFFIKKKSKRIRIRYSK